MKKITILFIAIWVFFFCGINLSAAKDMGQIEITAIIKGNVVPAVVKINKSKDRNYAYWSMYQPAGPTLATPLSVSLPVGKYFLHVKPMGIHSPVKERVIPFMMSASSQIIKRIDFTVGRLKIISTNKDSGRKIDSLIYVKQGWRQIIPPQGKALHSPLDTIISPGQYQVNATKTEDQQRIKKSVTVVSGKTTVLDLQFKTSHVGYLLIDIEMKGKVLTQQQYRLYGEIVLINTKTQKKIHQVRGGYGQPYQLPSDHYDIKFHSFIVGKNDILIKNVVIADNTNIRKKIHLQQPGEIKISALWTDKPKDLLKCLKSKNPFDMKRLGTLFGGPGGTPGRKCFDNNIGSLITEFISVDEGKKYIARKNDVFVKPGVYKIKVWPFDHKYLAKTIDSVEIKPAKNEKIALEFRWPFIEKKLKIPKQNKYVSTLERKIPLGVGEIHVAATINGQPTTNRAIFSVGKLNYRGEKTNSLFQFYTPDHGNPTGLKLPLKKSIPTGFYDAYVEPFGPHLVLQKKRMDFYMAAGEVVNKTVNFNTGRLKINFSNKNTKSNNLRIVITFGNNITLLKRYHKKTMPFDAQVTPGNYTIRLYTIHNSVYFSKKITVKAGETVKVLVP